MLRAILTYFRLSDSRHRPETFQVFKVYLLRVGGIELPFRSTKIITKINKLFFFLAGNFLFPVASRSGREELTVKG